MRRRGSILAAALLACGQALAAEDAPSDYGVPPLVPCPAIRHAPSEGEAALLIMCSLSEDRFRFAQAKRIYNARVRMGRPREYAIGDPGSSEADSSAPVYPIETFYTWSTCGPLANHPPGQNCDELDFSGTSICYRRPTGEWKCTAGGARVAGRYHVPPPRY